jgi:hypothetical protein
MSNHRKIATLDFGSHGSSIACQIYNKSAEVKKRKKDWFYLIWKANGWDGESTVWRVEFRFKRKFLAEFDLNGAFDVLGRLEQLWRYATEQWLRYVDRSVPETNISRYPTHAAWEVVQNAYHVDLDELATDPQAEKDLRLHLLTQTKPLQAIEQSQALLSHDDVGVLSQSLQEVPIEVLRDLAHDQLAALSTDQLETVLNHLMPEPFREVRSQLIKRERRMAKKKSSLAGALGYLRSYVALLSEDELPKRGLPDLFSSLLCFYRAAVAYDKEKGRSHVAIVHKKRMDYGFVSALQLEQERKLYGVDLPQENAVGIIDELELLQIAIDERLDKAAQSEDIA